MIFEMSFCTTAVPSSERALPHTNPLRAHSAYLSAAIRSAGVRGKPAADTCRVRQPCHHTFNSLEQQREDGQRNNTASPHRCCKVGREPFTCPVSRKHATATHTGVAVTTNACASEKSGSFRQGYLRTERRNVASNSRAPNRKWRQRSSVIGRSAAAGRDLVLLLVECRGR